jgi:hypothetical protein
MTANNNILEQYLYFAKFVSSAVRDKAIIKKSASIHADYAAFTAKLKAIPETDAIPQIKDFIFSLNAKYVSNIVKNSTGYLMFVEYGNIDIDKESRNDKSEMVLAISIAHEAPVSNADMVEDNLIAQTCFDILKSIMDKMYEDYESIDNCQENELIIYPAELYPIMPEEFFDRGGWTAMFKTGRILK